MHALETTHIMTLPDTPRTETRPLIERLTGSVAIFGGLLALAVAGLVVVSVLGRWLFSMPVEGDFEFVKMATAIGVFAYLPYTQARRGNIMVDTFTGWMGKAAQSRLDAVWDLAYAAFMGLCAWGLFLGARDALSTGETTMQLQLAVWPAIGLCAVLCLLLVVTCIGTIARLIGWPKNRETA
ncbi:MAG: TRAP transporter small permease [Hyphomicrobiales bacterium]|nr:TRAP transporter small permease [Hyphomicrobiales bacterium]